MRRFLYAFPVVHLAAHVLFYHFRFGYLYLIPL